ncbi:CDP-alcohol phosphatidyltransferase [Microlunatus soli]|uniref:CDP-alcohol phosphatidyltransferase n=2 Tax=Microlunatus soli TaxID=630515 RepID=A0A1H1W0J1_9ACTN|nr:CDP-alcohol phosphatidyltransferase [Microlunatus soli]
MLSGMSEQPTRSNHPTMAELRAVSQPETVLGRRNSEHWAGALYLRKGSIYITRVLLPTGISANAVTWWIAILGLLAAAVLILPGWWPFLVCAIVIQLSIMIDCTDGEIARWRGQSSAAGVYIDRICHYLTETALPIGFGIHLDGGLGHLGGWTIIGMATGILVLLKKAFGDLVHVARTYQGWPKLSEDAELAAPRSSGLRSLRGLLRFFPFFRAFGAIEYSLILLVFATVDVILRLAGIEAPIGGAGAGAALGSEFILRIWAIAALPLAALTAGGYLLSILVSSRLRPPAETA